ncbi:MAG: TIGR04255 family protein [Actinobacteria bacterium]|nr:TIGR04255 family protein [Actinomycetota bacterium]
MGKPMPSFKKPPVMEVVCGVQFKELSRLSAAHLGRYWAQIIDDFPNVQDAPPLPVILDRSDEAPGDSTKMEVEVSSLPPLRRVFFIDKSDTRVIQLQENRFHYNWRRQNESDVYPRYEPVFESFSKRWAEFERFTNNFNLGELKPIQYELTYINHFLEGELWVNTLDLRDIMPTFCWRQQTSNDAFLPVPDGVGWVLRFPHKACQGHLHMALKQGKRTTDSKRLFILDLTVRGKPSSLGRDAMKEWFDSAREWIVRGFTDITSGDAHKIWEREQ